MSTKKVKPITVNGSLVFVPLTKGKVAVVDLVDLPLVAGKNWHIQGKGYAATNERCKDGKQRPIRMHRLVANTPDGLETDHINGDKLDNRRANLRHATQSQNQHNRTAYKTNKTGLKGVSFDKVSQKWKAQISLNGKKIALCLHETPEAAHAAYVVAAARFHGSFACTTERVLS